MKDGKTRKEEKKRKKNETVGVGECNDGRMNVRKIKKEGE